MKTNYINKVGPNKGLFEKAFLAIFISALVCHSMGAGCKCATVEVNIGAVHTDPGMVRRRPHIWAR